MTKKEHRESLQRIYDSVLFAYEQTVRDRRSAYRRYVKYKHGDTVDFGEYLSSRSACFWLVKSLKQIKRELAA
ncbi:hypothetical protein WCX72_09835 [Sulfurimonas sp. HSL1-6]|uniref:hypothetical protein n=1 Tax=Thiomicrolovo immobilis TaxID=3131935 RepID=UPI0031F76CF0